MRSAVLDMINFVHDQLAGKTTVSKPLVRLLSSPKDHLPAVLFKFIMKLGEVNH